MWIKDVKHLNESLEAILKEATDLLIGNDKGIIFEIKKRVNKRTTLQNAFYWLCVNNLSEFLIDSGLTVNHLNIEMEYTPEFLHEFNKAKYGIKTTKKLDTKKFSEYMERFFMFWIIETNGFWQPPESIRGYFERNGYNIDEKGNIEI